MGTPLVTLRELPRARPECCPRCGRPRFRSRFDAVLQLDDRRRADVRAIQGYACLPCGLWRPDEDGEALLGLMGIPRSYRVIGAIESDVAWRFRIGLPPDGENAGTELDWPAIWGRA